MRSEIGSEFWDIPISSKRNDIFPDETKWFIAGRTALKYIIQDSGIQSVSMPIWCCSSMLDPFIEFGVKVEFYNKIQNIKTDAIFVMDYFGYAGTSERIENYQGIIIRDLTHSIFSKKYDDADYYFGSLRKWAGFYTGGFAWGNWKQNYSIELCDMEYIHIRKYAMQEKEKYIKGESDNKDFLHYFEQANSLLKHMKICGAYEMDVYAAQHFDIDGVKTKRRRNAKVLLKEFQGLYKLGNQDCPLFVPIEIENRNSLRTYLIKKEIYCPVHWPYFDRFGKELSIICDQRYDEKDMNRICETVREFYLKNEKELVSDE